MKFGVIVFPGSNCDDDMIHVLGTVLGHEVRKVWHKEEKLYDFDESDCIIVPGGFSYGDYLRCGAIARFSPIMKEVVRFANDGGLVWGICNGFQILCEADLLPGVLLRNSNQKFICKNIHMKVKTTESAITSDYKEGEVLKIPIAHAEGRYHADQKTIADLNANNQMLFTYCDEAGVESEEANVNGSIGSIAGICNKQRNVFGMMPHPERASESILGNSDGRRMLEAIAKASNVMIA